MDQVASLPDRARSEFFSETAARMGVHPAVVEKDFWVTWILASISTLKIFLAPCKSWKMR